MAIRFPLDPPAVLISPPAVLISPPMPGGPAGSTAPAARDLEVRNAFVSVLTTVIQLVPAAKKRRWLAVQNRMGSAGEVIVIPALGDPAAGTGKFGRISLAPGDSVVFSETGDMPWKGAVYAVAVSSADMVWTEAQEYPIE